jgi:hypothetical protein
MEIMFGLIPDITILNNEVILISLYVDDKRDLPENPIYLKQQVRR